MAYIPEVGLETYIMIPFEIISRHKTVINHNHLEKNLLEADWELLPGHTPDKISDSGLEEKLRKNIRYQAYNYFHPFVRDYWFDQKLVKRYRHVKLAQLHAKVAYSGTNNKEEKEAKFDAVCELLHFTPNIGMLVLHLKNSGKSLELKTAQACLDQLRRLYPPYLGYGDDQKLFGGHYPVSVTLIDKNNVPLASFSVGNLERLREQAAGFEGTNGLIELSSNNKKRHSHLWAAHWTYLLEPFSTDIDAPPYRDFLARQLGDDRAALASLISIQTEGNDDITQLDSGNLKRLCFADAPGNDRSPYSERFLTDERFFNEYCYTRFWYNTEESSDKPSLIMNSGYAFCWLGDASDGDFFANPRDGAPVTFRHIYAPMAIIAHFQKAFLLVIANKLTDLTPYDDNGKPVKINTDDFQQLKLDMIAFTQTYWFSEISPQEQGIELFEMWRKKLRLQIIHEDIRQQINDIVEYNDTEATAKLNRGIWLLTICAILLGIMSLATGILGMNTFAADGGSALNILGIDFINEYIVRNAILLVPLLAVIFAIIYWRLYTKNS